MTEVITQNFTLETAIELALEYHKDQKDRAGLPYTNHLFGVTDQLEGEKAKMVGVLHDSVEDTPLTLSELRKMGCPEEVIEAINLVTHPKDFDGTEESYFSLIRLIMDSGNQLAIDTKWADLTNNSDPKRLPNPTVNDLTRQEKYKKAKEMLKPLVSPYLRK
jgi:hypothetical protein